MKQQFDHHPFLWHLLCFSAYCKPSSLICSGLLQLVFFSGGCSFSQCEPLVCALLLVLTQHWFSCRCSSGLASGKELLNTERLVDYMAEVHLSELCGVL